MTHLLVSPCALRRGAGVLVQDGVAVGRRAWHLTPHPCKLVTVQAGET